MILEGIVKRGNIVDKSKQLCAYADDFILVIQIFKPLKKYYMCWKQKAEKWA
jgi:hypothetical protein